MSFSSSLPLLSPLVTRILQLSGFPAQLKTRDIQQIFSAYEDEKGGYKIKWVDDTTALVIFNDPSTAKKAYLQILMAPPSVLINDSGVAAKVRPYEGDDASSIIASVHNRQRSRSGAGVVFSHPKDSSNGSSDSSSSRPARGHAHSSSFGQSMGHRRNQSGSNPPNLPAKPVAAALYDAANGGPSPANRVLAGVETLSGIAGLPANPAVAARVNQMTTEGYHPVRNSDLETDLSKLAIGTDRDSSSSEASSSPAPFSGAGSGRIGDAGKRLVAGALGVRHPGLSRSLASPTNSSPTATPRSQSPSQAPTQHQTTAATTIVN